jgi:hypothetical protein
MLATAKAMATDAARKWRLMANLMLPSFFSRRKWKYRMT